MKNCNRLQLITITDYDYPISDASTLQHYIKDSGVSLLGYADDHSAYDSFNPKIFADEKRVTTNLEKVLVTINDWMNLNRLKLNPSKTEFVLFGSQQMLLYHLPFPFM